jgi:hypothetical protein
MHLYHFTSAKWALEDIRRRRLKIATLDNLNDPFELRAVAIRDQSRRKEYGSYRDSLGTAFGVLCFSRDWANPVQWSHYADNHRGICLGFEVDRALVHPITYRLRPYDEAVLNSIETMPDADAQGVLLKLMTTKFSHWRYEKEVRAFAAVDDPDPETGLFFADFSPRVALKEVIVGPNSPVTRAEVADALGDMAATVAAFKARLSFQSYRVVRQRSPSQWM